MSHRRLHVVEIVVITEDKTAFVRGLHSSLLSTQQHVLSTCTTAYYVVFRTKMSGGDIIS